MADQTTNYEFNLPEVDGSEDLWGDLLNQNWTDLDALLLARDQSISALEGRTLTAGDGLSGGGDLTQDRTISVDSSVVRTSQSIATGNGLTGGGDLSADRTITMGTPGTLDGGTSNNVTGDSHTHAIASTASRTDSSTTTLLQAAGMNSHRTSGDHDSRYAQLAGGAAANFTSMPQVGGDPIVESGSNSDGSWTRWADGTQQCYKYDSSIAISSMARTEGSYSFWYAEESWEFPVPFISEPAAGHLARMERPVGVILFGQFALSTLTPTAADFRYAGSEQIEGLVYANKHAVGRWK